jgi:dTDP-glucose pyrophosphorylase
VIVGLPDTIWFPEDALRTLGDDPLSFLLFPVDQPERFDAVLTDGQGRVREIRVKQPDPGTSWIWGAFKLSGWTMRELYDLWCERERRDEYMGTLVNAYLARGGAAVAVPAGEVYVDVGTLHGYREALRVLSARPVESTV